jgi:hypothetical protein
MTEKSAKKPTTENEELTFPGSELVDRVKKLVAEGNVRRLIVKKASGEVLLEIPLTAGVVAGGAMILLAPVLAALGALAALVAEVKLEVVRSDAQQK